MRLSSGVFGCRNQLRTLLAVASVEGYLPTVSMYIPYCEIRGYTAFTYFTIIANLAASPFSPYRFSGRASFPDFHFIAYLLVLPFTGLNSPWPYRFRHCVPAGFTIFTKYTILANLPVQPFYHAYQFRPHYRFLQFFTKFYHFYRFYHFFPAGFPIVPFLSFYHFLPTILRCAYCRFRHFPGGYPWRVG